MCSHRKGDDGGRCATTTATTAAHDFTFYIENCDDDVSAHACVCEFVSMVLCVCVCVYTVCDAAATAVSSAGGHFDNITLVRVCVKNVYLPISIHKYVYVYEIRLDDMMYVCV